MAAKKRKIAERDFLTLANDYARDAIADVDNDKNCKWIRLAAARYLKDRKRAAEKGGPFKFSPTHAREVCKFIEQLPHVEGKWETPTIVLHPAHVFFSSTCSDSGTRTKRADSRVHCL